MAKKRGLWAELQRELAHRQELQQQNLRMEAQLARQARREHEQAERTAKRQAVQDEKERRRLYAEDRKAEAADMTADLDIRIAELDSVLTAGIRKRPLVTFKDLKHDLAYPSFDPVGYDKPLPSPVWEQHPYLLICEKVIRRQDPGAMREEELKDSQQLAAVP